MTGGSDRLSMREKGMKRKMSFRHKIPVFAVLLAMLLLASFLPQHTEAQANFNILSSKAEAAFPDSLTFSISASGTFPITKIYLRYRLLNDSPVRVFSEIWLSVKPGTVVESSWVWQMKKTGGLPPGTQIAYWWLLTDEKGNKFETTPRNFIYFDTGHPWKWIPEESTGNITLFWYNGDRNFAEQLLSAANDALQRLERDAGIKLEKKVNIFVYSGFAAVRNAVLYAPEWTGGVAFTDFSAIVVGVSPSQLDFGKRSLAHELSHLVARQVSFNYYGDLPVWLNEGLAMWNEGPMRMEMAIELDRAIEARSFPTLRTLSSPFPGDLNEALLAYAVSQSVVDYLLRTYGGSKMLELLKVFKEGSGYDEALLKVYGVDMDRLFEQWRRFILPADRTVGLSWSL